MLTLPRELPLWELESQWILEFSKIDYRGQNPLDWRVIYIIGKLLKLKCLKWTSMTHLNTLNISYGQKKGWESNCQPLKVENRPNFLACRWHVTYCWKNFHKGYNISWDLVSIGGLHAKLWAPKVAIVPMREFQDSHLGIPKQNTIWMWASWRNTKYIIRG